MEKLANETTRDAVDLFRGLIEEKKADPNFCQFGVTGSSRPLTPFPVTH